MTNLEQLYAEFPKARVQIFHVQCDEQSADKIEKYEGVRPDTQPRWWLCVTHQRSRENIDYVGDGNRWQNEYVDWCFDTSKLDKHFGDFLAVLRTDKEELAV